MSFCLIKHVFHCQTTLPSLKGCQNVTKFLFFRVNTAIVCLWNPCSRCVGQLTSWEGKSVLAEMMWYEQKTRKHCTIYRWWGMGHGRCNWEKDVWIAMHQLVTRAQSLRTFPVTCWLFWNNYKSTCKHCGQSFFRWETKLLPGKFELGPEKKRFLSQTV